MTLTPAPDNSPDMPSWTATSWLRDRLPAELSEVVRAIGVLTVVDTSELDRDWEAAGIDVRRVVVTPVADHLVLVRALELGAVGLHERRQGT